MSGLAGLGALAGGLSRGLADGQAMSERIEDQRWQREQRGRQRTLQDRDDALNADLEAANAAMVQRMQGFRDEFNRTQGPGARNNLTLGGSDSSMPDQTGNDTPSAVAQFKPTDDQLLAVARARTDTLFAKGRHDAAVKQWLQDEGLRGQLRKQAAEKGMLAFKSSGDVEPLLRGVYDHLDDGYDLSGVVPVNNPDPKAPRAWDVQRRNSRTGEEKVDRITADQVEGLMQFALDPVQAAKYSLMEKLAGYRGDQQRQTNDAKHDNRISEIEAQNEGRLDVEKLRSASREQVAKMNFDGRVKVAEIRGPGGSGKPGGSGTGGNVAKTLNLADGRVLVIMRDGSQRIATGDDGKPLTSLEFEKQVGSTANTVSKSLSGLTATPQENRATARTLLPQQPAQKPAPANRRPLDDFQR
ncbi:MAG TPA: hypothetical protein VGF12_06965 [Roseateles sp.]|uniref:hypothetical protein n=1 Tax=Roseateles sp. TaxID=1971397 RepID=UPI002EDAD47A